MTAKLIPLSDLTATAIHVLCREMGIANTARFIRQFSKGLGNYTEQRDEISGDTTVDEIVTEIKLARERRDK